MRYDKEVKSMFDMRGWKVLLIMECELKKKNEAALIYRLLNFVEL